jgi:two-component system NtrC family sensor kinase
MAARALATGEPAISPAPSLADGVTRLHAVRRVEGYPVVVVHGLHEAAPRRVWLRHVVAIGGVSGALSLALLWLTWRVQRQARREAAALARERDALQAARMEAERRADAEAALREGQRLEALGQLAAGVAHDFRNVVQAVQGGARLIGEAATRDPGRVQALAGMVAEAAGRGAELTNRMLDFARGRVGPGEAGTDPAGAVEAACTLLRATLGSRHRLACRIADGLPARVRGGRAELEAALMNLAINARDAMPAGGTVSVAAEAERNPPGLARGAYARITVSDTGEGMDEATLRRATEAFFTTKPRGKGTGLGLATVRAFAEGAGGGLAIASTPGEGTAVTLRLPAA